MEIMDILFSSSSDSSDSSNDESNSKRPKIGNFVTEVVDEYSDEAFKENFRMYRSTFDYLVALLKEDISTSSVDVGRPTKNAKEQLLLAIWYFATPESYRSICGRFNVGKATGQRIVRRVTEALLKISNRIIHWPDATKINEIKREFARNGLPNTIGCIDGSYIPIPQPTNHGLSYICRKNFPCLQGVCDSKMLFIHCYAGEVGNVHDAAVLKRSEIWEYLTSDMFPEDTHILGDKAYRLLPTLMTPYRDNGHLDNQQKNFNYMHSKCRSLIERAFALLKNHFRILKYMEVYDISWGVKYIIACCILHNICILKDDIFEVDCENEPGINDDDNVEAVRNDTDRQRYNRAVEKRNNICTQLNQMLEIVGLQFGKTVNDRNVDLLAISSETWLKSII